MTSQQGVRRRKVHGLVTEQQPTHGLNPTMKLRMVGSLIFHLLPPSAERLGMRYKVLFMCGAC